jgi:hypothetical protein
MRLGEALPSKIISFRNPENPKFVHRRFSGLQPAREQGFRNPLLLHLRVLGSGLLQDGDVGVGVLPEGQHAAVSHGDGDGDTFSLGEPIVDRAGVRSDRGARPEGALDHQEPAKR